MPPNLSAAATNLDKGIIFLVVALHCKDRFAWATCTNSHFDYLAVKEVGKVLHIDIGCDAADVQASRLPGGSDCCLYPFQMFGRGSEVVDLEYREWMEPEYD